MTWKHWFSVDGICSIPEREFVSEQNDSCMYYNDSFIYYNAGLALLIDGDALDLLQSY